MNEPRKIRFLPRVATFLAAVALLLLVGSIAEACPTCKAALENDPTGGNIVRGYFWSILFMMGTPFAILGGFSGYMYHEVRKARRQRDAEQSSGDPTSEEG